IDTDGAEHEAVLAEIPIESRDQPRIADMGIFSEIHAGEDDRGGRAGVARLLRLGGARCAKDGAQAQSPSRSHVAIALEEHHRTTSLVGFSPQARGALVIETRDAEKTHDTYSALTDS